MIYLITCSKTESCKIGYSNNPDNRLIQLQTGNPFPLELTHIEEGELDKEREYHKKFKHLRLEGEWFNYNKEIKDYFGIEEYVLIYPAFWDAIITSNISKSDLELLAYLIRSYGKNIAFSVTHNIKEEVAKVTKKATTSYNNTVRNLLESKFIYKVGNRSYKINPTYAFEGSSTLRKKAILEMLETCPDCK